jgi:hypothetical protein
VIISNPVIAELIPALRDIGDVRQRLRWPSSIMPKALAIPMSSRPDGTRVHLGDETGDATVEPKMVASEQRLVLAVSGHAQLRAFPTQPGRRQEPSLGSAARRQLGSG